MERRPADFHHTPWGGADEAPLLGGHFRGRAFYLGGGGVTDWNGGECPVDPKDLVAVSFRLNDWETKEVTDTGIAKNFRWDHNETAGDIIAYRKVSS